MNPAEPLRILALLEADSITGTAKAVLEFAREAPDAKVIVAIFVRGTAFFDNVLTRTLQQDSIAFEFIREKGRFDTAVLPALRQLVSELNPQIIWTNSVKSHFLVHLSGVRHGRRWVAFHHGYTSTDVKMLLYNQLDRFSLRHADRVLTVCQPFARQLAARGVVHDRIRVQHMPIRPLQINPPRVRQLRLEFGIHAQDRVILSIGRLSKEKGHADLIKAFGELRSRNESDDTRLFIVGEGPERVALTKIPAPPNSVFFTGQRDDAASFYGMADIFALPSYSEGTPNVLLEAMSAGVPIIATNVGGIPELATDGENAILVEKGNVTALTDALENLLTSTKLRQDLGAAGQTVVNSHSPKDYAHALLAVFREAVAAPEVT